VELIHLNAYLMLFGTDRIIAVLSSSIRRRRKKKTGRPRMDDRKAMSAIFYVLRTGCQWNALPRSLVLQVRYMTDSFQECRKAGVFKGMWIDGLAKYDKKVGSIGNGRLWMA
jgi:transposase